MTPEEIASEFAEIFDELPTERVNEMLAKNVPFETIEFFARYAEAFADGAGIVGDARGRLPNLLLFGYLIRVLEERLITMYKQGDGYFWIGGPGEEAFNVVLGMLVHKGEGPAYDYLHLHYRSSATLLAMGADPVDSLRQMKNTATDPYSRGRNFVCHYSVRKWNVAPVSSPIEVQYSIAPGTAMAHACTFLDFDRAARRFGKVGGLEAPDFPERIRRT